MFKIFIGAKDMKELRANVIAFLEGMDDFSGDAEISQVLPRPGMSMVPGALNIMSENGPAHFAPPVVEQATPSPSYPLSNDVLIRPDLPVAPAPKTSPITEYHKKVGTLMEFGVDKRGLPWDERIHAVTQGVNKDGSWRTRRGVEQAYVTQVEHELISKVKAMQESAPITRESLPAAPTGIPSFAPQVAAVPVQTPLPPVISQPAPSQPTHGPAVNPFSPQSIAPVISAHTLETFKANLVPTLFRLTSEGKLTPDYIQSLKDYFKVDQIWQVNDSQLAEMFEGFVNSGVLVKAQ